VPPAADPAQYIAPMPGDLGRAGIVPAPDAASASWAVAKAAGGGVTLTSLGAGGGQLSFGSDLNGTCAHSYSPPSASVYVAAGGSAWAVVPASSTPSYPPRAECVILKIYDQTGNGNHMLPATPAINNPAYDNPVNATRHPISVGGHAAFGAYFESGMGYRAQNTSRVARGNDPETLYMVTSGTHYNDGECAQPSARAARPALRARVRLTRAAPLPIARRLLLRLRLKRERRRQSWRVLRRLHGGYILWIWRGMVWAGKPNGACRSRERALGL